jgi:hypothetical protein
MKGKKLSALLLAGLMTASAVSFTEIIPCTKFTAYGNTTDESANVSSGKCGENVSWSLEDGVLTISGEGEMYKNYYSQSSIPWDKLRDQVTNVVIENGVENISDYALSQCEKLTSITIADTVKSIGRMALSGTALKKITLPKNLQKLDNRCFDETTSLEEFIIDEDNTKFATIDGVLFNKDITKILRCPTGRKGSYTIPDTVKVVDSYSFAWCEKLESIVIPESVIYIQDSSFYSTNINSVTINNPVCDIHPECDIFSDNTTIYGYKNSSAQLLADEYNIDFKALNTEYMDYAKGECGDKISWFFDSEGVLYILGSGTLDSDPHYDPMGVASYTPSWNKCTSLVKQAYVSEGITEIQRYCFFEMRNMTEISLPDTLEKIGYGAFYGCSSLTNITIPKNVTELGEYLFSFCYNLESITILNPDCVIADDDSSFSHNLIIYGYEGSTAEEYANNYNRKFVSLGEKPITTPTTTTTTKTTTTTTTTTTIPSITKPTLIGDANCDGKVSIADATAILQSLGNPDKYALSEQGAANADIADTGNGVTVEDAAAIQRIDAKLE